MIIFNNIKITQDNKYLIIDAEIEDNVYYKDMYIDRVIIDNQDTYIQNGPSDNPIYTYQAEPQLNYIYTQEDLNNQIKDQDNSDVLDENNTYSYSRSVHLKLDKNALSEIENNMFFVYVIAGGIPLPETPCGYDVNIAMKVVINTYPLYTTIMNYLEELNSQCDTPVNLIDTMLRIKALDACVQTGNNFKAIELWNKYFRNKNTDNININCGCNG